MPSTINRKAVSSGIARFNALITLTARNDFHLTIPANAKGIKWRKCGTFFDGTFRDSHESGAKADGTYIQVTDPSGNLVFQIVGGPDDLDLLTTANDQIHQSSCGKNKSVLFQRQMTRITTPVNPKAAKLRPIA